MPLLRPSRWGVVFALTLSGANAADSRLAYATFLPGNGNFFTSGELGLHPRAVADPAGNTYIAYTTVNSLPRGGFTTEPFLMKVAAVDKSIAFLIHVGVSITTGIALDKAGNVYVVGGYDVRHGAVTKVAPDGSVLYRMALAALPYAVAIDSSGAAYVAGTATADFQTTPGVYKSDIGPAKCLNILTASPVACNDAFVAKISSDGAKVVYATFLGGTGEESAAAVAVDATGSAVVAGVTRSPDFPATAGGFQPAYGGAGDGFAARLDPSGRTLVYATFLGGSAADRVADLALDTNQNVYITGSTDSADFPVTRDAFQPKFGGKTDAFFLKLSPSGQAIFSSYLGGPTSDLGKGVAIGPGNRLYVALADQTFRTQPEGAFVLALDARPRTPCDPTMAIMAIDGNSGQVIDHYAFGQFGGGQELGDGGLSVDATGIVHISAQASPGLMGNSFIVTPGANRGDYQTTTYLAVIDFSAREEFAEYCQVNAASLENMDVSVAPGEIVSLFGVGLGPDDGITAQPDKIGNYPRQLGGTRVRIGDIGLPLLYVSKSQVNAVVPYGLSVTAGAGVQLTVEHGDFHASYPLQLVFPSRPGIFQQNGQAAALNEDGSVNGAAKPAPLNSIVTVFATGLGALQGPWPDDATTPLSPPWPGLAESFQAYIGAATSAGAWGMEVLYAGPAPGMPPGVYQVNARVPNNAVSGNVPIQFVTCRNDQTIQCAGDRANIWIQPH